MIIAYLKERDIPCKKYHYTVDVDGSSRNFSHCNSLLRLSPDGKKIIIYNLKPFVNKNYNSR